MHQTPSNSSVRLDLLGKMKRRDKIESIVTLFYEGGPLPDAVVQYILEYAGLLFVGRKSMMWVQYC